MIYLVLFLIGLSLGSFGNVLIARLPYHKNVITGRSYCPKCGHMISWYENIPVLSYLLLRGKCAGCGTHISLQYPFVEIICGLLFVLTAYYRIELSVFIPILLLRDLVFVYLMFILAATDFLTSLKEEFDYMGEVPNIVVYIMLIFGLIISFYTDIGILYAAISGIVGYLILYIPVFLYYLMTKKVGMGDGDFKLIAIVGVFYGIKAVLFTVFFGACLTVLGIFAFHLWQKITPADRGLVNKTRVLPFVPFLALASFLYIFLGSNIIRLYINLVA